MGKTQSEAELAQHFVNHFRDQDLYFEVPAAGIIDIVMKCGIVTTAIEVKTTFNFGVLEQAINNCGYANYSYIAVPESKNRWFQKKLCKDYGIGLLVASKDSWSGRYEVTEEVSPKLNRRVCRIKLEGYHKESIPGSQSQRITAFGNYVRTLKDHVNRHPNGVNFKDVFREGFVHYSSASVFKSCLAKHIQTGIVTGIRLENGIIYPDKKAS